MLDIITPCIRPENLLKIKKSINSNNVRWNICFDTKCLTDVSYFKEGFFSKALDEPWIRLYALKDLDSCYGNAQRNFLIDKCNDYIYFLDDDNIMHSELLYNFAKHENTCSGMIFHQDRQNHILKGRSDLVIPDKIDTAMYIVHKNIVC